MLAVHPTARVHLQSANSMRIVRDGPAIGYQHDGPRLAHSAACPSVPTYLCEEHVAALHKIPPGLRHELTIRQSPRREQHGREVIHLPRLRV